MKLLITGGNGNIAKIIKNNFISVHEIKSPGRNE
jgi:hypothetical protein